LEAMIQPRTISPEQRQIILDRLRPVPNKCDVVVVAQEQDIEARRFAQEITGLLQTCGFDAKLSTVTTMQNSGSPVRTGLRLVTGASVPLSADALLKAFLEAGVENIKYGTNPGLGSINHVDFWVNAKPLSASSASYTNTGFALPAGPQPE